MTATEIMLKTVSSLVNGNWAPLAGDHHPVFNPATGEPIARLPFASTADVNRAVESAHAAFQQWKDTPVVDRVQPLYRFKTLLEKHANEIADILTRENGKVIEDARVEVRRAIQMVEVACGMPSLMMGDSLNDVARGIDSRTVREPLGVCVGITPFNFPAMVPMWMYPFALACGNTFILKPSEKVPLTPTRCVELLLDAGLPANVFQLLHGGKETVDALLAHPLVRAISFVGSTPVAKHIYTTERGERQARTGARRRQESSGCHARRQHGENGGSDHQLRFRRGRRTLPRGQRPRSGGRRGGAAPETADRKDERDRCRQWRKGRYGHGSRGHERPPEEDPRLYRQRQ